MSTRREPSDKLIALLERLRLADPDRVRSMASRVRRLAGPLPDFDSVWVDALAQARVLTAFQASEINAGRGECLLQGDYVISRVLPGPHYAECFAARHSDSERKARLYLVRQPQVSAAGAARALGELAGRLAPLAAGNVAVVEEAGVGRDGVWAVCRAVEGVTAADWMIENGRFPPAVVSHLAREMAAQLGELHAAGAVHGDVGAAGLVLDASGTVYLPMPALRGVVRPCEGYSFCDLQPEAYDYLPPERVADGSEPSVAGDWYACGLLWWHLLTGRAPLAGGNSLARLKAAHAGRIVAVRQLAPDVPSALEQAISACLARDPRDRPRSAEQILEILGPSTRACRQRLAHVLSERTGPWLSISRRASHRPRSPRRSVAMGVAVAAVLLLVASLPLWWRGVRGPAIANRAEVVSASEPKPLPRAREAVEPSPAVSAAAKRAEPPRDDPAVVPAGVVAFNEPREMILSNDDGSARVAVLDLKPGVRVRGRSGMRPLVRVPADGLVVDCEDVVFDGIDFVWDGKSQNASPKATAAMLVVAAGAVEFRGCSFTSSQARGPSAIAWRGVAEATSSGELRLTDCAARGVAAVVDCQADGGLTVAMTNTLCISAGPILRLHQAPPSEQAIAIHLERVTLRGETAVLECRYGRLPDPCGPIAVAVDSSVLDCQPRGGLLILSGIEQPDLLLSAIHWTGQGSLVTPETTMALWRNANARHSEVLPENELEVGGVVRSQVKFAGHFGGAAADSRVIDWQVPLRSAEPPGANPDALFLRDP